MNIIKDIAYSNKELTKLDFYIPDNKGFTTIIYFHGSGITSGSKNHDSYVQISEHFCKNGYAVANVDYSLYPNTKFPEYLFDCAKAVAYTMKNIMQYEANGKFVITGQSAGAWMSTMLMLANKYLLNEGVNPESIDGWIIESGQMTSHFNVIEIEDKLNPLTQRIDERAPLYFINENTKFSKALFFYYDNDMPMRKEQNILLYKTVKAFNDNADIEMMELPGTHCYCSSYKDEDGEYRYVKESLKWLNRKGL